ncbi:MAG: YIP1 family protein [Chloroflexi bacterium]|nr:YIP1 family protein [Chloroflexota bacterium]
MSYGSVNFAALFNSYVSVLTKPGKASFDATKGQANWMNTLVGVIIWGLVAGLFSVVSGGGVASIVTAPIGTLIVFFIGSAIVFVLAKVVGGTGDFNGNSFMLSLYLVPIGVINAVLGFIPAVGGIVSFVLGIYGLFLLYFGLQSYHGLDSTKALIVVGILFVIALVLFVLVGGLLLATLYSLTQIGY